MPLYSEFFFDLNEKFQVASKYDANVEQYIWSLSYNFLGGYADNRHTLRPVLLSDLKAFKMDKSIKISVLYTYDTNEEYRIWRFCYSLFLSYADNKQTYTQINR